MQTRSLLHITDFHIHDPNGERELLRKGKYKEYLGDLADAIKNANLKITAVCATGDFVNFDAQQHFAHAKETIEFLVTKLGLTLKDVAICLGNHDLAYTLQKSGDPKGAREQYVNFSKGFMNESAVDRLSNDRGVLCKLGDDVWVLMLDTLLGCTSGDNPSPGPLPVGERDAIMELVGKVPLDAVLVIGSHYPVEPSAGDLAGWEDKQDDWFNKHVWINGTPLRERISRHRKEPRKTIWLSGDIHRNHEWIRRNVCYVTTGRIGTLTGPSDSQNKRQAVVVEINPNSMRVHRFQYEMEASETHAEYGDWVHQNVIEVPPLSETPNMPFPGGVAAAGEIERTTITPVTSDSSIDLYAKATFPCEILTDEGNQTIRREIIAKQLYTWGRFATSSDEVLLSWISIGPLMNVPKRLGATTRDMAVWLRSQLHHRNFNVEKAVLLGIDCWGAVLASQLSVVTGIRNFCIATRGRGEYHTSHEVISDEVTSAVNVADCVVLVTDVIATGRTLRWVFDQFHSDRKERQSWFTLSILSDPKQPLAVDCGFIKAHGTACQIARPFLPADHAPDADLVPIDLAMPQSS